MVYKDASAPAITQQLIEGEKKRQSIEFDRMLRAAAQAQLPERELRRSGVDPLLDHRYRPGVAQFQFNGFFHRYPETSLVKGAEKLYSGRGSSRDAPQLHQLFLDSIKHPELVSLYTRN